MKFIKARTIIGLMTMVISIQSFALPADRFHCKIEIKGFKQNISTTQEQEFSITRYPLNTSPEPHITLTAGQYQTSLKINSKKEKDSL